MYAQAGVRELWFINPEAREIGVFQWADSVEDPVRVFAEDDLASSPCLPGWSAAAKEIFEQ